MVEIGKALALDGIRCVCHTPNYEHKKSKLFGQLSLSPGPHVLELPDGRFVVGYVSHMASLRSNGWSVRMLVAAVFADLAPALMFFETEYGA